MRGPPGVFPLRARVPAVVEPGEQAQHRRESEERAEKAPGVNRTRQNQKKDHHDDPDSHADPGDLEKEAGTKSLVLVLVPRREGAVLLSCHLRASMTFPRHASRKPILETRDGMRAGDQGRAP